MKAIETKYKGYRFRSRMEARWAVFFDYVRIKWEYEKEGYVINGTCYLPDFWLPELNTFVEIKGNVKPSDAELQKCIDLSIESNHPVYLLAGPIPTIEIESEPPMKIGTEYNGFHFLNGSMQSNYIWTMCEECGMHGMSCHPNYFMMSDLERLYCDCYKEFRNVPMFNANHNGVTLELYIQRGLHGAGRFMANAYDVARQARFEFGAKIPKWPNT
jgi:hypothetical protein